jgi:hypothetical protein
MRTPRLARCIAVACLGLALLAAPSLATAAPVPPTAPTAPAEKKAPPSSRELPERQRHYAERQAASPQAAEFEGNGVGVYIGGSTLAVVLLIVLIVVLL